MNNPVFGQFLTNEVDSSPATTPKNSSSTNHHQQPGITIQSPNAATPTKRSDSDFVSPSAASPTKDDGDDQDEDIASPMMYQNGSKQDDSDDDDLLAMKSKKVLTDFDRQRVRLKNIIEILENDCDKMRHFAFLPIYFLMLVSIFILLLTHRADNTEAAAVLNFVEISAAYLNEPHILSLEKSSTIRQPKVFFEEINVIMKGLIDKFIDNDQGIVWVLPMALLRQVRVEKAPCWTGSTFFRDSFSALECPGSWSDAAEAKDYSIYKRNTAELYFNPVVTPVFNWDNPDREFYTVLRMKNQTVFDEDVANTVANEFIDTLTRGLVYDLVLSFPQTGVTMIYSIYWLTTDGGLVQVNVDKEIFNLFTIQRGVISMDSIVFFLAIILVTVAILEVSDNYQRIDDDAFKKVRLTTAHHFFFSIISPWQITTFVTLFIIMVITGIRIRMWTKSTQWIDGVPQTENPTNAEMMDSYLNVVDVAWTFDNTYELYCYAFMLMTYRVGYAAQHLSKLSLIARTFKLSFKDLSRVFNVFIVSMIIFSMIFHAIFGQMIKSMRTLPRTGVVLIRYIIQGDADPDDYVQMRASTYALGADFLLGAFFLLFWLLLLNFVLAIISSAFMNSYTEVRSADTITNVVQTYILFNAPMYYVDRFHRPEDLTNMGSSSRAAAAALSVPPSYYTRLRLLMMIWRWRVSSLNSLNRLQKRISRDRLDPSIARYELPRLMPPPDLRNSLKIFKTMKRMFKKKKGDQSAEPLNSKKIGRSRASEAGLRAVAFLVSELFDAVHTRELAEAKIALDTHTKTMKKLNRATERVKYITAAVSNFDNQIKSSASLDNASFASFGGKGMGLLKRVASMNQVMNAFSVGKRSSISSLKTGSRQNNSSSDHSSQKSAESVLLKNSNNSAEQNQYSDEALPAYQRALSSQSLGGFSSVKSSFAGAATGSFPQRTNSARKMVSFRQDVEDPFKSPRGNNNNSSSSANFSFPSQPEDNESYLSGVFASPKNNNNNNTIASSSNFMGGNLMDVARQAVRDADRNNNNNKNNNQRSNNNNHLGADQSIVLSREGSMEPTQSHSSNSTLAPAASFTSADFQMEPHNSPLYNNNNNQQQGGRNEGRTPRRTGSTLSAATLFGDSSFASPGSDSNSSSSPSRRNNNRNYSDSVMRDANDEADDLQRRIEISQQQKMDAAMGLL